LTLVGALGRTARASVDARGALQILGTRWSLDWWIGADDRWRIPAEEVALRQELVEEMPVVRTSLRVPHGDAIQRVFGAGDGSIVLEVENDSPAPFALALVVSAAHVVSVEGETVVVDGAPAFTTERPSLRWATAVGSSVRDVVVAGDARDGPFAATRDRRGRVEAAFLHPVAHRATLRVVLAPTAHGERDVVDHADVVRGWQRQLARGMRVELPDPALDAAITRTRAQMMLAAGIASDADILAVLEDWGLDEEARLAWERASIRHRRRARRRALVRARETGREPWPSLPASDADLLVRVRDLLVREDGDTVDVVRVLPESWRGANLEVRDAPLRRGALSYALRWHGPKPALLWDAPEGLTLRAPGLDGAWSTTEPSGEALLGGRT